MSRRRGIVALALVGGLALPACSDDTGSGSGGDGDSGSAASGAATGSGDGAGGGSSSTGSSPSAPDGEESPTTSVDVPDGVTLTDPGARLSFGDTARVAHEVTRPARDGGGPEKVKAGTVLALTVDSATRGRLSDLAGFNLTDPYQREASYFYVRVTVRNVGEKRFGDVDVPLRGISGENTLLPPVRFTSAFARCPTEPLPRGFAPGARFRTCLVFLSPDRGALEGVSYRPTETSTPIEWRGEVARPPGPPGPRESRGSGGGG